MTMIAFIPNTVISDTYYSDALAILCQVHMFNL